MKAIHLIFAAALLAPAMVDAACPVPPASSPTASAKALSISKLGQFLKCEANDPLNDQSPCNTFASRSLESIYGVTDFKVVNGHMSANKMADFIETNKQWVSIGNVYDLDNNLCAQALSNQAYPVIAIKKGTDHGHVALIIPGEPAISPTWGFLVANSASFLIHKPDKAYINGMLSKAFQPNDAMDATFYYRKPDGMP
jgi:hypothetical protein